jgi:hypothetical protein
MLGNINKLPEMVTGDIRIYTKGTNINLRSEPNTTSKVIANVATSGTEIGKYAKFYANDATNFMYKWYEFNGGKYGNGWIRNDLCTLSDVSTAVVKPKNDDAEAQQMLDDIVAQDIEIMNNLNSAAAMINSLKTKGVSTTASENKLTSIYASLQERQEAMQKPTTWGKVKGTISNAWGSVKNFFGFKGVEGLDSLNVKRLGNSKIKRLVQPPLPFPRLKNKRIRTQKPDQMQGMGVVITLTTIAIIAGISVLVGGGTAALVLCKPWKNKSNIDLKESKELKALLENADPVVAQKIREDIKTQLVDAYTVGNRQGSVSSFMSIGKYVVIAGVALWLAPKLMDFLGKTGRR